MPVLLLPEQFAESMRTDVTRTRGVPVSAVADPEVPTVEADDLLRVERRDFGSGIIVPVTSTR